MECSEFIRLLFQKCSEWGRPLYLGRGDAHKAFDSTEHPRLDRALEARDTPLCLRAATLRELVGVTLQMNLQGIAVLPLPLGRGGKQGASDAPCNWNFLLDDILADTVREWARNCFGVSLEDAWEPISHRVWADDIWWFSNSWDELCTMSQDLTSALADGQLSWKPSSLQYLMNAPALASFGEGPPEGFCTLDRCGAPLHFTRVSSMDVLGVLVDGVGDSLCALEHRLSATLKHFYARFPQLACKRTSLKRRVKRLYGTVFRSALHGAGGWTLSQALLVRCESFELSLLRRVVQVLATPGESFASYMQRPAISIRGWIRRSGQTISATLVLRAVHGWAGHLARLPADSPISRILKYRNLEWWRETQLVLGKTDRLNRTQWRHSRPGQFARWEACLERRDKRWIFLAADRDSWHLQKIRLVTSESLRLGYKNGPPNSENSEIPCDAKHDRRIRKRRPASAAPAPRLTPPAPLSRGPHSPYPHPGLRPCPGPVLAPPPPSLSTLSSLSAPLPSFWSVARVRESLPAGVSLSCFTGSDATVDLVLCVRPPKDPLTYTLWKRVLGPLNAVAACVRSKRKNVLLSSSSEGLKRANHVAHTASASQSSSESVPTWPPLPLGTVDLHIRVHFIGSSNHGGFGGAGFTIFLDYFGGSAELFSCGLYLGKRTSANSALLQACGCTLLAVFATLSRLSDNSRLS